MLRFGQLAPRVVVSRVPFIPAPTVCVNVRAFTVPSLSAHCRAFHASSNSSSSQESSHEQKPPPEPRYMNLVRLVGGVVGIYLAFKFVNFVNDKFVDPAGAAMRRQLSGKAPKRTAVRGTLSANGSVRAARTLLQTMAPERSSANAQSSHTLWLLSMRAQPETSPYPYIKIPPLDPTTHTLSQIFSSVLEPLVEFDKLADEFVDRKHEASLRYEGLLARKRTQNVPVKEAREIESQWAQIQSEERSSFAPRLEYLSELYYRRSEELMARSQMLAEQRFEVGHAAQQADAAHKKSADAENQHARQAQDEEMHSFQELCKANQHLLEIVNKYNLRSPTGQSGLKRQMQRQQMKQMSHDKNAAAAAAGQKKQ